MTLVMFTAVAVVRERERGTMELLIATPVSRSELMVGKVLPYAAIGLLQTTLVLVLGTWLFQVPIRGSLLDIYLAAVLLVLANLALGLLMAVGAHVLIRRMIVRPLLEAGEIFRRIAEGDLTRRVADRGKNEIGALLAALKGMQDSLVRTVSAVRRGVDEINVGAREISAGNTDLSSRTEEQAASLEETAARMEELAWPPRRPTRHLAVGPPCPKWSAR
ncbi:hypothetical protein G6F46_013691 [Rhizopus delemar]|nr:hypothetical protein G6F46_013691 [Rhizopus delemar]